LNEQLIEFLGKNQFDIKEQSKGKIEVRTKYDGVVDQEVFYSLKEDNGEFEIFRISRGNAHQIITLKERSLAFLYLGILGKDTIAEKIKPFPESLEDIDEIANKNLITAEKIIRNYLSAVHYALFHLKNEAICLIKRQNLYIVYFVDGTGQPKVISDDNDEIGLGVSVLCHYTWSLMLLNELTNEWSPNVDKNSSDYRKIQSHFLNAN
jgi:hypothetical protein